MEPRYVLITGGAGFIGTNVVLSYLKEKQMVHIFDNLSRPGVEANVAELQERFPHHLRFTHADVRDRNEVKSAVGSAKAIYHLAAQVAVTTSLQDPLADLETNLLGTLNVLEAVRHSPVKPPVLFTSTNKVYGKLRNIQLCKRSGRWEPEDQELARSGVAENQPLEFLSPYGCSKGSADQYVLDYAHSYGIPATVFRMSCIYGPYQLGSEDQGWVAHFVRQAMKGEPVTIFGDGRQVRDLLFVGDLVRLMRRAQQDMNPIAGEAFNVGGGPDNCTSLLELLDQIRSLIGAPIEIAWGPERLADQRWYVVNPSKAKAALQWIPEVSIREGVRALCDWYGQRPALVAQSEVQVA
ncbi:MAG: SDR family NAD(P)-dependent oxidoreductase [Acidobacteriaceae bacterium]|nr:SDR family NAD(P)-dependent oxidoreductase [Acidobacteriaceae bacterium]